jgi:hypothetical protein
VLVGLCEYLPRQEVVVASDAHPPAYSFLHGLAKLLYLLLAFLFHSRCKITKKKANGKEMPMLFL